MTTADDTAILTALDRLDRSNRADTLIGLAEHADALPGPLIRKTVRLVADKHLTDAEVRNGWAGIVEADRRRRDLDCGVIDPCDVHPEFGRKDSDYANAADILCSKVHDAVAVLVKPVSR